MRLSSAREAKFEFLQQLGSQLEPRPDAEPGIAVGLSPRPDGDYVVAVRAQTADGAGAQVVAEWTDRYGDDVDARIIGIVRKQQQPVPWYRQRVRPLQPGVSVSHVDVTAGTIGTFARRLSEAGDAVELLSNNHVLANENQAELGDGILQPGAYDGGDVPDDLIGASHRLCRRRSRRHQRRRLCPLLDRRRGRLVARDLRRRGRAGRRVRRRRRGGGRG